ncbi:MAG: iron-sulfur cluster assembly accessory protein [Nitrospirae bacterium]|nr:iron-sulfur cluster assembly accessory protein [Nitrospirota bacterium]
MITITEKAAEELKKLLSSEEELKQPVLRLKVVPGGCSGYSYAMAFEEGARANDAIAEVQGVKVAIDPDSQPHLKGLHLDFQDGLTDGGFKIQNPNAKSTCGCGSSFQT